MASVKRAQDAGVHYGPLWKGQSYADMSKITRTTTLIFGGQLFYPL